MTNIDACGGYVVDAGGDEVVIKVGRCFLVDDLIALGFVETSEGIVRNKAVSDKEKADLLSKVRDIGLAFSVGPGWSPSAVFEELRDRQLVLGRYRRISWLGPGKPIVDEI
jgi:hypothetical protein